FVRMSPDTTVQITTVQLQKNGSLQSAEVAQKIGRTFVNVQHLVSGATFKVGGHSVSASVRGTQFEMVVRQDHSNLIKVFEGTVGVNGKTTASVSGGQEISADANGTLSAVRAIQRDLQDPYALTAQCSRAVSNGTTAGTLQTSADRGAVGRQTLSNSQIAKSMADAGVTGVTLKVQGTSPTSARIYYYSDLGGTTVSWTVVFYAASPNLGAVVTQVSVRGVNVTTQVLNYLGPAGKQSISTIPQDFTVDRVYSCAAGGDTIMVVEGHR